MTYQPKIYKEQGGDRLVAASGGAIDIESGAEIDIESGGALKIAGTAITSSAAEINKLDGVTAVAADLNKTLLVTNADRITQVGKIALAAADTAGGVFAWQNPESSAIFVTRLLLDITTKTTGACTLDCGPAASAATLNDTLIDALDANAATGLFTNTEEPGTNGKLDVRLDANGGTTDYVTGSKASGAAAGLVGFAYIEYIKL